MDIIESPGAFTVTADAPGFAPEDIKVELDDNRITISARKDQEKKEERDGKVVRRERQFASFSRSFTLPDNIKTDNISASLDKGVLRVTLPKAEPQLKPQPKRITVMAHEGAVEEQVLERTGSHVAGSEGQGHKQQ